MDSSPPLFLIEDLHASVEGNEILKGVSLRIEKGEVHAIMGPNGSGKSTLANTLMGHPKYKITAGDILYKGESILGWSTVDRARKGIFLAFQYPTAIPGVSVDNFLRMAYKSRWGEEISISKFRRLLREKMGQLEMGEAFARRYVNDGFSGGEKKRNEILQMAILQPEIAILDETDSGLDIDALRTVTENVNRLRGPELAVLLITHYKRILNYIQPDYVHVLAGGRILRSGDLSLADELEAKGYDWILRDALPEATA